MGISSYQPWADVFDLVLGDRSGLSERSSRNENVCIVVFFGEDTCPFCFFKERILFVHIDVSVCTFIFAY